MKKALIFGVNGQAGYYLSRFLLRLGYEVHGTYRNESEILPRVKKYKLDLLDPGWLAGVNSLVTQIQPDEIYNLASCMFAPDSWLAPVAYTQVNAVAVAGMLQAYMKMKPDGKFFQAGSAEVFDLTTEEAQKYSLNENSPRKPRNPYGVAKLAAENMVRVYREKGMFACTGILFNMESSRRSESFFTRQAVKQTVEVALGLRGKVTLGKLSAVRDWGLAEEYVEAMHVMLQAAEPFDATIATGEAHSCYDFVREALESVGLKVNDDLEFDHEAGPPDRLCGSYKMIREKTSWYPRTKFAALVRYLVAQEMKVGESTLAGQPVVEAV